MRKISNEAYVTKILEETVMPSVYLRENLIESNLPKLEAYLNKVPSVSVISSGKFSDYKWWVKFNIDIEHKLAWHAVQGLGFVLNYLSISERLPTTFKPVSPAYYLNGGPKSYLSWVIESEIPCLDPAYILAILKERLPDPIEDENQWNWDEIDDD